MRICKRNSKEKHHRQDSRRRQEAPTKPMEIEALAVAIEEGDMVEEVVVMEDGVEEAMVDDGSKLEGQ